MRKPFQRPKLPPRVSPPAGHDHKPHHGHDRDHDHHWHCDPHEHDRGHGHVRLAMCFKNFAAWKGISHIGLGVSGANTCEVLKRSGVQAESVPLTEVGDLYRFLEVDNNITWKHHKKVTHVVVSAPWIDSHAFRHLCERYPDVIFTVLSHSNVGFLQADPKGVRLLREAAEMQAYFSNFRLAGNCLEFCNWVRKSYSLPCWLLPNLYNLGPDPVVPVKPLWKKGEMLRIGSFGAVRPLKNTMTAAGTALQISTELKTPAEFWISANRTEGGGDGVVNAIREMLHNTNVTIVPSPWQPWPEFRTTIQKMHLHLQPSYTESFNITVADAIAVGVPSVVSPAIAWAPRDWQADPDDVGDMVKVGMKLLRDRGAAREGFGALEKYIMHGVLDWKLFLGVR